MAYDEGLAERIRERLEGVEGISSKEMFGGVAFLIDGRMFVGVVKDELMVRVGKERHAEFVARPGARTMDFTGRPMFGYVFVAPSGSRSDKSLAFWVEAGLAFTRAIPTKAPSKGKALTARSSAKKARRPRASSR
jgi:TfoX/Sxy family transcriptional regulator of competence genes